MPEMVRNGLWERGHSRQGSPGLFPLLSRSQFREPCICCGAVACSLVELPFCKPVGAVSWLESQGILCLQWGFTVNWHKWRYFSTKGNGGSGIMSHSDYPCFVDILKLYGVEVVIWEVFRINCLLGLNGLAAWTPIDRWQCYSLKALPVTK